MADVKYSINGLDFTSFGAHVAQSEGITSKLAIKERSKVDWPNYHGTVQDLSSVYFDARTITLDLFMEGNGPDDFIGKYRAFVAEFEKAGTQRLKIDVGSKPLVYEVYAPEVISINKKWDNGTMIGTFKLKLIEPEPVKKVLSGKLTTAFTVSSAKLLNVYWGDGTHTFDVFGNNVTLKHTYADGKSYEIVITGQIDEIKSFKLDSNATVIWNKLQ